MADEISMAMASRSFDGHVRVNEAGRLKAFDFIWLFMASFFFFLSLGF